MNKLLIGTTNSAKQSEWREFLLEFDFEFFGPEDFNIKAPEESGKTLEENAILKAKYYFEKSGIPTLADDGGFEIEALNGEPGTKSHRWLGFEASDEELIEEVMRRMEEVPEDKKGAKFSVVLAVASPLGIITSHSHVEGVIPNKPSSKIVRGYPFDSVLFLPNYNKYVSELNAEEHEILNHRRAALEKIKDILLELAK